MSGKASVRPLLTEHFSTLHSHNASHISLRDIATHFGLPVVIGVGVTAVGIRVADASQIIAGAAILAGFSFGLAVFVFQLRLESGRDPRIEKGALLLELLDELFANVAYLILVGIVLAITTIAAVSLATEPSFLLVEATMNAAWTVVIVTLSAHYVVTIFMCLKRLRRAYEQLTI